MLARKADAATRSDRSRSAHSVTSLAAASRRRDDDRNAEQVLRMLMPGRVAPEISSVLDRRTAWSASEVVHVEPSRRHKYVCDDVVDARSCRQTRSAQQSIAWRLVRRRPRLPRPRRSRRRIGAVDVVDDCTRPVYGYVASTTLRCRGSRTARASIERSGQPRRRWMALLMPGGSSRTGDVGTSAELMRADINEHMRDLRQRTDRSAARRAAMMLSMRATWSSRKSAIRRWSSAGGQRHRDREQVVGIDSSVRRCRFHANRSLECSTSSQRRSTYERNAWCSVPSADRRPASRSTR